MLHVTHAQMDGQYKLLIYGTVQQSPTHGHLQKVLSATEVIINNLQ